MSFIRNNLFLVVLTAVVVALGGLLMAVNSSVSTELDKQVQKRLTTDMNLRARRPVNAAIIKSERDTVERVKESYDRATERNIEWNRKNLPVLQHDPDNNGKLVDAFPMTEGLPPTTYDLTRRYLSQLDSLLGSLHPTAPASEAEKKDKADGWEAILKRKQDEQKPPPDAAAAPGNRNYNNRASGEDDPGMVFGRSIANPSHGREGTSPNLPPGGREEGRPVAAAGEGPRRMGLCRSRRAGPQVQDRPDRRRGGGPMAGAGGAVGDERHHRGDQPDQRAGL